MGRKVFSYNPSKRTEKSQPITRINPNVLKVEPKKMSRVQHNVMFDKKSSNAKWIRGRNAQTNFPHKLLQHTIVPKDYTKLIPIKQCSAKKYYSVTWELHISFTPDFTSNHNYTNDLGHKKK